MKINYSIDQIKINKLKEYNHIVVNGWCIDEEGNFPHLKVLVNDREVTYDLVTLPRRDVCSKYSLNNNSSQCGFRLFFDISENLKSLKIIAEINQIKEIIADANEIEINKIISTDTIEYSIDSKTINKDTSTMTINGWAISYYEEPITYKVFDNYNNEIEVTTRIINREDLYRLKIVDVENKYCGFMISFPIEEKKDYYLIIDTNTCKKEIDLKKIGKISKIRITKDYIKALNGENLVKGFKYLKEKGLIQFLKRVKQGPGFRTVTYAEWFDNNKVSEARLREQRNTNFIYQPKISIVVPTYNTPLKFLNEMIDSVISQSYSNWELCIADGSDENNPAKQRIKEYVEKDSRIKVNWLEQNYGIAENTNRALALATGEYVGLFDHDDLLTPDLLFEIVTNLQEIRHDIIYTDEDKYDNKTKTLVDPNFKPDFSIDLFRSHNYITHFFVVKTEIIKEINGFRSEFDGSQDYDLMFRCIEKAQSIYHIPKILYHWRMHDASTAVNPESKMYCYDAGKRAIEEHYQRIGIKAKVEMMPKPLWGMYHTIYETIDDPLVSIIIPNYEHKDILETCIDSLINVNEYKNFEIIIVENNSSSKEIFNYYNELECKYNNIKVLRWEKEFNYSALNNFGAKYAKGKYLLFLNNDTEVISSNAISEMLGCCMRKEVGIVGAKLLYEDDTVQHAGVVIGFGGFAGHVFTGIDKDDYGYMVRARINCNYSAVTAACMMVDRECFDKVNGFDEKFKVACNDIDFCLRVRQLDKLVVYNAFSLWHHYESKSRGYEDNLEKIKRFESEVKLFQERWIDILTKGDPYYNSNFKIEYGPFILG
ncbi:MAG: glycosyltransferase family 2 protein [Thomasclavelia ramosa]